MRTCERRKSTRGRKASSLLLAMFASFVLILLTASPATAAGLKVTSVSQQDIVEYASEKGIDLDSLSGALVTYKTEPNYASQPYAAGEISTGTASDALAVLNFARYVAGLSPNVTLDSSFSELAQAASLVSCLNGGLSHSPSQPSGLSNELYQLGEKGAGSSNLSMGHRNPASSVLGYLSDSDRSNIQMVGHRRWVLNPTMGKTGFGYVGGYSAMYAFDRSNKSASESNVAWPAQNMPVELFSNRDAWSLSTGSEVNESGVSVTLTRKSDGKTWKMGRAGSDGELYVNNGGYGQKGCIIFRPYDAGSSLSYSPGDSFHVLIEGAGSGSIEYDVNFFSLYPKKTQTISCQSSFTVKLGDPDFSLKASALGGARLSYVSSDNGIVSVASNGTVSINGIGTATITISAGETDEYLSASKSVTVVVERPHTHVVDFYDGDPEHGTVTISPEDMHIVGHTITLTITPDEGYRLESISAQNCITNEAVELSGTGNTRTFTMPDADVRLHATFVPATAHKITAAKPDGGTVTLSKESALAGDEVTVTLAPSEGYELTSVSATDATGKAVALSGTGSTRTFVMPDADVTLTAVFTQTAPEPGSGDGYRGFPDVMGDEWFATDRALGYVVDHGLIEGYKDGSFGASRPVTRAQLVTVLWRMAGKPSATSEPFLDADPQGFYWNALQWARANKIASGYSGTNRFGPDDRLTRETLATFAASYARLQGIDTSGYESELNAFADASKVSTWARSSMGWCVHVGIFSGQGSTGLIDPQGVADRAQMAKIVAMLHRDVLHLASDEEYAAEKDRQSALAANPSVIRSTPSSQNSDIVVLTGTVRKTMGTQFTYGGSYPIYYLELPAEVTVTGTQYGPIANTRLILPKGYESYVGKTVSVRTGVSIRPTASIPEAAITMLWCNKYCTFQRVF